MPDKHAGLTHGRHSDGKEEPLVENRFDKLSKAMARSDTVTRRSVLKGIGTGAALAWSVPMLSSLVRPERARAATVLAGSKACTQQNIGGSSAACNWCVPPACPGTQCGFCFPTVKGCCFCTNNFFCSDARPCRTKRDCPAGWECGYTCCSQTQSTCLPPPGAVPCPIGATGKTAATAA